MPAAAIPNVPLHLQPGCDLQSALLQIRRFAQGQIHLMNTACEACSFELGLPPPTQRRRAPQPQPATARTRTPPPHSAVSITTTPATPATPAPPAPAPVASLQHAQAPAPPPPARSPSPSPEPPCTTRAHTPPPCRGESPVVSEASVLSTPLAAQSPVVPQASLCSPSAAPAAAAAAGSTLGSPKRIVRPSGNTTTTTTYTTTVQHAPSQLKSSTPPPHQPHQAQAAPPPSRAALRSPSAPLISSPSRTPQVLNSPAIRPHEGTPKKMEESQGRPAGSPAVGGGAGMHRSKSTPRVAIPSPSSSKPSASKPTTSSSAKQRSASSKAPPRADPPQPAPGSAWATKNPVQPSNAPWSQPEAIHHTLKKMTNVDPDEIFTPPIGCNLDDIFGAGKWGGGGRNRTSSGRWDEDHFTAFEERAYREALGIHPGALCAASVGP